MRITPDTTNTALRFDPGETSKTITVRTTEDLEFEADETFYVYVTDARSKLIDGKPSSYIDRATGIIRNDDVFTAPRLQVSNASAEEGESLDFTVTLDREPARSVTWYYATYRGSAGSSDYVGRTRTALTFSAGQTSRNHHRSHHRRHAGRVRRDVPSLHHGRR